MKKPRLLPILILLITLSLVLASCGRDFDISVQPLEPDAPATATNHILNPDAEIRGVWIASVYNIDYPSKNTLSAGELRGELDYILDACEKNKINTIFFQVRPACDALYDSDIFPVSSFLSADGELTFDPLEYIITEGHKRNIYIHAWVNPLRVTMSSTDTESLPEGSPAKDNPAWTVSYADGRLYFNAGLPEVRSLVADGVREIVERYDVDGVVFDDYFYPYPVNNANGAVAEFDDKDAYEKYGGSYDSLADWRRDNINKLVEACYNAVHETDPECEFGVSPFAVWQNNNGENGGSDTSNFEAYHSLYCDALAWIDGGYLDYISPQIYWQFETKAAPFDVVARWWNAQLDGTDIKLYISHASYRYEDGEWADPEGELSEQISFARSLKSYRGSIFYGYDELKRNTNGAADDIGIPYRDEVLYTDIQSTGAAVTVTSPPSGSVTYDGKTYLVGISDPYYPLTLNGQKISQTKSGYFSAFVTLEPGENILMFEQNGVGYAYTITYLTSSSSGPPAESGDTVLSSAEPVSLFPASSTAIGGDILWVSCVAPYGSYVTAEIGGSVTELWQVSTPSRTYDPSGPIGVTYGANAALPKAEAGEIKDCGQVKFTVYYNGGVTSADGCRVRVLGEGAMLCVSANNDYTELKISQSSLYYNDYTVQSAKMTDYATNLYGGFYQLRMGGFVSENDVTETEAYPSDIITVDSAAVLVVGDSTEFRLKCADRPPYNGALEDGRFVLTFYNVDAESAPVPKIEKNPLFSACEIIRLEDRVRYSFALHDAMNFYGFDLRYEEGEIVVEFKNPRQLGSELPLDGISIVLDAGHGGDDPGAAGAYSLNGIRISESDLNLAVVLEAAEILKSLGANVSLMRASDTTLSLYDRMDYLEENEPDLCISVHQNSMNYNVDITRVRGTLALWCMDSGRLLSDTVGRSVARELGRTYLGSNYQMLAMCRNPKFPAALIEVGFMTSVEEYEQMTSGGGIKKAARGIADGVLDYFEAQGEFSKKYS